MGLMNSISIAYQSQVIWEPIPWMASMKGGVLDIWTCFFHSDVHDLFLLLEQARGDNERSAHWLFQALGKFAVITEMHAK